MAKSDKPKTDINESLCCIALRYIQIHANKTEDDFVDFILNASETEWSRCFENVEVKVKDHGKYIKTYKDYPDWIVGSFRSAKKIESVLGVSLQNYIISKPEEGSKSKAHLIKEECTSAIKNWAQEYQLSNAAKALGWTRGILGSLKSDKINISDIILVKNISGIYDQLEENVKITNNIKYNDLSPSILPDLITPKNYNELLNLAWKNGEIYGISLKKIDVKNSNVPAKIINFNPSSANQVNNYIDEFNFFISNLVGAAKSGKNYTQFEKLIKKSIELEPVSFTAKDRLEVKYKFTFKINNQKKSYDYVVWTNFGQGTNSVYFQQVGSGSASGEGGITLSYFNTICKEIPELKQFIEHVKDKRSEYFLNACEKYGIVYNSIKSKMGSSALSSGKYNTTLYTSDDFRKLVYVLLTNIEPINEEKYNVIKHGPVSSSNFISKNKESELVLYDGEEQKVVRVNYKAIQCLEYFFKEYVDFLSSNNSQMGRYFGVSSQTVINIVNRRKKIQEEFEKLYKSSVLGRQLSKLNTSQKSLPTKQRIKGTTSTETKKLKEESASKIKLEKRTHDMFERKAKSNALKKFKEIEPQYKKSFALLANAEFGYMYSNHAEKINELVKKQVLLSLYAAASGRGYIIFDGKRFEIDDYFEKDVRGVPFLKIGM
jgi:hypothetical protein